jgi:hypothetical protein
VPQLGIEPRTFLLQGGSASHCATRARAMLHAWQPQVFVNRTQNTDEDSTLHVQNTY